MGRSKKMRSAVGFFQLSGSKKEIGSRVSWVSALLATRHCGRNQAEHPKNPSQEGLTHGLGYNPEPPISTSTSLQHKEETMGGM